MNHDELDAFIKEMLQDPEFARGFYGHQFKVPLKLKINGNEYTRRRRTR